MVEPISARQKILLIWMSKSKEEIIDPIRVMKGAFILTQESLVEWFDPKDRYEFEPYNYGPVSFDVYDDLRTLRDQGYIDPIVSPGRAWTSYRMSEEGKTAAATLADSIQLNFSKYIGEVSEFVMNKTFSDLLTAVYERYPEYATKSLFGKRPQQ